MDAHLTIEQREKLRDALGEAQRIGMLGKGSLDTVIDRSLGFVRLMPEDAHDILDIGSGGGDPGLVIAMSQPDAAVVLVDRRSKRTDLLARLVSRLGLSHRVEVVESDVALVPQNFPGRAWDVVTGRGFGSPTYTASLAAPLIRPGGLLLVAEPPDSSGERWKSADIEGTGLILDSVEFGIARLVKKA